MTDYRPLSDDEKIIMDKQKHMWEQKARWYNYLKRQATLMLEEGIAAEAVRKEQEWRAKHTDADDNLIEVNSALEIINSQLTLGVEIKPSLPTE